MVKKIHVVRGNGGPRKRRNPEVQRAYWLTSGAVCDSLQLPKRLCTKAVEVSCLELSFQ